MWITLIVFSSSDFFKVKPTKAIFLSEGREENSLLSRHLQQEGTTSKKARKCREGEAKMHTALHQRSTARPTSPSNHNNAQTIHLRTIRFN
jgi:hypothetical protein